MREYKFEHQRNVYSLYISMIKWTFHFIYIFEVLKALYICLRKRNVYLIFFSRFLPLRVVGLYQSKSLMENKTVKINSKNLIWHFWDRQSGNVFFKLYIFCSWSYDLANSTILSLFLMYVLKLDVKIKSSCKHIIFIFVSFQSCHNTEEFGSGLI